MSSDIPDNGSRTKMHEVLQCLTELFPDQHPITTNWIKRSSSRVSPTSIQKDSPTPRITTQPGPDESRNSFDVRHKAPLKDQSEKKSVKKEAPKAVPKGAASPKLPSSACLFTGTLGDWSTKGRTSSNRSWDDILDRFNALSSRLSEFSLKKIIHENLVGFQLMDIADLGTGQRVDVVAHKSTGPGSDRILISVHGSEKTARYEVSIGDLSAGLIHHLVEIGKTND